MKRSTDRILTTHGGSLARPSGLLDLMKAEANGQHVDPAMRAARVQQAVADVVAQQRACGIDLVSDGEQSKPGFFSYVAERLGGFEAQAGRGLDTYRAEVEAFPEYYEQYLQTAMLGGMVVPAKSMVCTGPVTYRGQEQVAADIANLTAALERAGLASEEAFVCAVAPSGVGSNQYYPSDEEYLTAVANALHVEYKAIVDAGFDLQVDDPFLTDLFSYSPLPDEEKRKTAMLYVEAVNHALRGIPRDRVRFHTCYGINEGPRVHDAPLAEVIDTVFRVNAGAFSFEAANPRHEHVFRVFETVKPPSDAVIIPGVISHATNIVEHPETIAERIIRFAEVVGREKVVAGADCGFSSQATYTPEIHPRIVWEKFRALSEGARIATLRLW
jgi:5-methyltetrahydropteroyltriglutamate--homocysteine methyltransferase